MTQTIGMVSLGCPKNQVDGEMMLAKLAQAGFAIVGDANDADLIIVNTCGFIEDAKRESIEQILETAQLKQNGRLRALVVTGCLAQRYQDQVIAEIPEIDAVIGIGANADIVKVCQKALAGVETAFFPDRESMPLGDARLISTPGHWAYLKVADGCSNCCTYCAIPGIRGPFRSRPMEEIAAEAEVLAEQGVRELILIAQDTTRYGEDLYGELRLPQLLKQLVRIEKLRWIRLFYCYPDRLTEELLAVMREEDKVCNYIDIPLQHADCGVLKRMNRRGDEASLKQLMKTIRDYLPDASLRTTFIAGFPGETEAEFETLEQFIRTVRFDRLGCFAYSPEEDTPAAQMENQIADDVKRRRCDIIMDAQYEITLQKNRARIGETYEVLVDRYEEERGCYYGRSYMDAPEIDTGIYFSSESELEPGMFVQVLIEDCDAYDLTGKRVNL